jgi:hypothetical protein
MAQYATLQEAYNIDSFGPRKRNKNKPPSQEQPQHHQHHEQTQKIFESNLNENFMNDYTPQDDCYYKKYGLNIESCPKNNTSDYKKEFCDKFTDYNGDSKCTPIQAPIYSVPISDDAKKKYDNAMNISLNSTTADHISYDEFNKQSDIKSVQPYYNDDLEKYLNINNFQNAVNYPSAAQMQPAQQSSGNGTNTLQTSQTSQTSQTPQNSQTSQNSPASQSSDNSIKSNVSNDNIIHTNNNTNNNTSQYTNINNTDLIIPPKTDIKNKKDIFYKNLINIGLFVFIGIVIIMLCDQITEIAINIGMKRTMIMLEPYLNKMQELNQLKNATEISEIKNTL